VPSWSSPRSRGSSTDRRPLDLVETEALALIDLVPDAPYGHSLLGFVGYERGRLPEAARHLTKALDLDPTDADVLFMLCITLQAAGQIEAAQRLSARFHEMDPLSPFAGAMLCVSEWFSGHIGRHLDALERSREMDPDNPIINWALGYTYALMGRTGDAARQAEWMRTHAAQLPYTVQLTSLVDGMEGRSRAALDALAKLDLAPLDAHHTFHIAESYAMAGDATRALALLEHAVDHGMYPYKFYAEYCPFTVPLRGSAEFDRIVAKAAPARRGVRFVARGRRNRTGLLTAELEGRLAARCLMPSTSASSPSAPRERPSATAPSAPRGGRCSARTAILRSRCTRTR